MWPKKKPKKIIEDLAQSIVYDNFISDNKIEDVVLLYDEQNVLLFERPKQKRKIKRV